MQNKLMQRLRTAVTQQHRRRIRHRILAVLACAVVFCTAYALILPAITLESSNTGTLSCSAETLGLHTHTDSCYDESGALCCGYADFAVHSHNADCYDADSNLICTLPEIKAHTHSADCYAQTEAAHTHTEDCYQTTLTCELTESEEHQHSESCFETVLCCGLTETSEPTLICTLPEIILHTHTEDCYDAGGNLICGMTEVKEHIHTADCFASEQSSMIMALSGGCTVAGCELDDALVWTPSTENNPFGGAIQYSTFLFGDLKDWNDIEGNAAVRGDLADRNTGITYSEGSTNTSTRLPIPKFDIGLLLGGQLTGNLKKVSIQNGSVICSEGSDHSWFDMFDTVRDHIHDAPAADIQAFFDAAYADLSARNRQISETAPTGTASENPDDHSVTLTGTDPFINIFELSASQYAANGSMAKIVYLDIPYGSYAVINIRPDNDATPGIIDNFAPELRVRNSSGSWVVPSLSLNNDNQAQSQRILFNFDPAITEVNLKTGFYLYGSLLAPQLDWNITGVYVGIDGTVVLNNADGGGTNSEFHHNPFIPGAQLTIRKEIVCDSNESGCPLQNLELAAYYVDLTLESVEEATGTVKSLKVTGLCLDGSSATIQHLTPGVYQIKEEAVYTLAADGITKIYIDSTDWEGHSFSHAVFTDGSPSLTVTSGDILYAVVTNHYKTEKTTSYAVRKQWQDTAGNAMTPPAAAEIEVQLFRTSSRITEAVLPPAVINAASGWFYRWDGLALKDPETGENWEYSVRETAGWPGYTFTDGGTNRQGIHLLINRQMDIPKNAITAEKTWRDASGNPITDPTASGLSATLKLYRREGYVPADIARPYTVTVQVGENTASCQAAKGSGLELELLFYSDWYYDANPVVTWDAAYCKTVGAVVNPDGLATSAPDYMGCYQVTNTPVYLYRINVSIASVRSDITLQLSANLKSGSESYFNIPSDSICAWGSAKPLTPLILNTVETCSTDLLAWDDWAEYTPASQPGSVSLPIDGAEHPWQYSWTDLPEQGTDADGNPVHYQYFVKEIPVPGYTASYLADGKTYAEGDTLPGMNSGFITILNRQDSGYVLPETGGHGRLPHMIGGTALILGALILGIYRRRKEAV